MGEPIPFELEGIRPAGGRGSGGGLGIILTMIFGADAAYRGIGVIIQWRGEIEKGVKGCYDAVPWQS